MDQVVLTNDTRRADFDKFVAEAGRNKAKGDDSFCAVFARTVKASQEGVLSLEKDKEKRDDAQKIWETFAKGQAKRSFADPTKKSENSDKVQVSKMRTGIKMGQLHAKGIDSFAVIERAAETHKQRAAGGMQVKGAYSALIDVARAQLDSDTELTDEQIVAAITPKEGAEKDLLTEGKAIERRLERVITGEAGFPFAGDEDLKAAFIEAHELIRDAVAQCMVREEHNAKQAKLAELCAELGVTVQ
jgi:hypothetical protein